LCNDHEGGSSNGEEKVGDNVILNHCQALLKSMLLTKLSNNSFKRRALVGIRNRTS
jgi:hypothetical protein